MSDPNVRLDGDSPRPIFLVGSSRSGTAMIQSMLNNAGVHLAGETHYFDDLRVALGEETAAALGPDQRRQCEDYFLALSHRPYGHDGNPEKGWMRRDELTALAGEIDPGPDGYFEAFCRLEARHAGKARWGEKTPRHVFRLEELLTRYPNAQAVCMVRDARAVVSSYRDWRNQGGFDLEKDPQHAEALKEEEQRTRASYHILVASLLWRSALTAAHQAQQRFGPERVSIVRYEEFVRQPEKEGRALIEWLGLEFTPALLDVELHNSSVSAYDASGGVSTDPLERWKRTLSPGEIGVIESCCGKQLTQTGYTLECQHPPLAAIAWAWITLPFAVLRAAAANRERIPNLPAYLWRRLQLALGRSGAR